MTFALGPSLPLTAPDSESTLAVSVVGRRMQIYTSGARGDMVADGTVQAQSKVSKVSFLSTERGARVFGGCASGAEWGGRTPTTRCLRTGRPPALPPHAMEGRAEPRRSGLYHGP